MWNRVKEGEKGKEYGQGRRKRKGISGIGSRKEKKERDKWNRVKEGEKGKGYGQGRRKRKGIWSRKEKKERNMVKEGEKGKVYVE